STRARGSSSRASRRPRSTSPTRWSRSRSRSSRSARLRGRSPRSSRSRARRTTSSASSSCTGFCRSSARRCRVCPSCSRSCSARRGRTSCSSRSSSRAPPSATRARHKRGRRLPPAGRSSLAVAWDDPGFLSAARAWIERALGRRGSRRTGPIEQPHVRPWSTVLRVPTTEGDVYFKAARPGLDHDAGVTAVLARLEPRVVLAPLAVDAERGWMLLPDGGERLREVLARERHPRRWLDLLPRYAELQIASTAVLDELLACGLPDYRTPRLGGLAGSLAVSLGMAPPSPARLAEAAAELDAAGLPATV